MNDFNEVYQENQTFIEDFLKEGYLDKELDSEEKLLERFSDMYYYSDTGNRTFRLVATEHKTPDRAKAKTVQLFNFGVRRKKELYALHNTKEEGILAVEELARKFIRFSMCFNDQRRFRLIEENQADLQEKMTADIKVI